MKNRKRRLCRIPQRTALWFDLKKGFFTASEIGQWIFKDPAKLNKAEQSARLNLVFKKIAAISGGEAPLNATADALEWGNENEPYAVEEFHRLTGVESVSMGFVAVDGLRVGCSPDRVVLDDSASGIEAVVEVKCPYGNTHVKYLYEYRQKIARIPVVYLPQVHWQMAVCEADYCHFFAWAPNMPPLLIEQEANELTEAVERSIDSLMDVFYDVSSQIGIEFAAWDKYQKEISKQEELATA